ncbi:hypothetical protein FXO37_18256 [Capsicum annuum]|nr:hypothetical protein FXO37_18256 [Capsicum annuum]
MGEIPELEHRLFTQTQQKPWISRILTDGVEPAGLHNLSKKISKSSLNFKAKFWWEIMRLRLMPTSGDDHLEPTRALIVSSLIEELTVDFGLIISDELFFCAHNIQTALPFLSFIIEFCKQVKVPLISGVNNEIQATHKQDIEKMKDVLKLDMRVNRPPAQQTQSVPVPKSVKGPLGSASMLMGGTADFAKVFPQYSEYRLNQENFAKYVRV